MQMKKTLATDKKGCYIYVFGFHSKPVSGHHCGALCCLAHRYLAQ